METKHRARVVTLGVEVTVGMRVPAASRAASTQFGRIHISRTLPFLPTYTRACHAILRLKAPSLGSPAKSTASIPRSNYALPSLPFSPLYSLGRCANSRRRSLSRRERGTLQPRSHVGQCIKISPLIPSSPHLPLAGNDPRRGDGWRLTLLFLAWAPNNA